MIDTGRFALATLALPYANVAGGYSEQMVAQCSKLGMKPVCDHPHYCASDALSLYLGQSHHLSHRAHRTNNGYIPDNFYLVCLETSPRAMHTAYTFVTYLTGRGACVGSLSLGLHLLVHPQRQRQSGSLQHTHKHTLLVPRAMCLTPTAPVGRLTDSTF